MPDPQTLSVFAVACAALVAIPGPAVLYIVGRSVADGRRAGLVSMLGIETGNLVQVFAAAAGVAAIILSSATAFSAVKYAGAAYLVYLGLSTILERRQLIVDGPAGPARSPRRLYWEGVLVGTLNPKLALFLLAFLPQFVDPGAGAVWLQTLVLGGLFALVATLGDSLYALVAGTAAERLRTPKARRWAGRLSGGLLLGLGVWAALAEGGSDS